MAEFDYLVVGGGTASCIVAAPSWSRPYAPPGGSATRTWPSRKAVKQRRC